MLKIMLDNIKYFKLLLKYRIFCIFSDNRVTLGFIKKIKKIHQLQEHQELGFSFKNNIGDYVRTILKNQYQQNEPKEFSLIKSIPRKRKYSGHIISIMSLIILILTYIKIDFIDVQSWFLTMGIIQM